MDNSNILHQIVCIFCIHTFLLVEFSKISIIMLVNLYLILSVCSTLYNVPLKLQKMNDENKNEGSKPGNSTSNQADELKEKVKDLAGQAEDFVVKNVKKFQESGAFGKLSDAFVKVEEVMEKKSQEFHSGEMSAKFEKFRDKTESQANEFFDKLKEAGRKIGDQVDSSLDARKGKKDQSTNQDGGGI